MGIPSRRVNTLFAVEIEPVMLGKMIISSRAPDPVGPYPHARRVGDLLFISGMGPRKKGQTAIPGVSLDSNGKVTAYDIEIQCRAVFENVRLVLEDAGGHWDDIVDVTVFLTNIKDDFSTYNRIYAEFFSANRPARTTVEVRALPTQIAIEVKAVAVLRGEH